MPHLPEATAADAFRHHCIELLVREGWEVHTAPPVSDLHAALVLERVGERSVVDFKNAADLAGHRAREVAVQLSTYARAVGANQMLLVIDGQLPPESAGLLKELGVEVWDQEHLSWLDYQHGFLTKLDLHSASPIPGSLRLRKIELENFRGFSSLTLRLPPLQTTVLVGANGCGKTTLLRAAAHMMSWMTARVMREDGKGWQIDPMDIRRGSGQAVMACDATIEGIAASWTLVGVRAGARRTRDSDFRALTECTRRIQDNLENLPGLAPVPVVAFYPVTRAVLEVPERIRKRHDFDHPLNAYENALWAHGAGFRLFFEWFREREDWENELRLRGTGRSDVQLDAVRQAIGSVLEGYSRLRVERMPMRMLIDKPGVGTLLVDQLSDGEKCLLAMVGDLARRLAIANPSPEGKNPLGGSGVVLVDEVELHLHPAWQRRVIPALERTFPNCQFILSTHSPQVISHVPTDSLVLIEQDGDVLVAHHAPGGSGWDSNRILEVLMGVPERPVEIQELAGRVGALLEQEDLGKAHEALATLCQKVGRDDSEVARLSAILDFLEGDLE